MTPLHIRIAIAGAVMGFLETFSIWWVPEEPYPGFIIVAGMLNGALVALLIKGLLPPKASLKKALLTGGIVGVLMGLVTFLAKGAWVSWDAPYVVPAGLVTGTILGAVVRWMGRNGTTEA